MKKVLLTKMTSEVLGSLNICIVPSKPLLFSKRMEVKSFDCKIISIAPLDSGVFPFNDFRQNKKYHFFMI